MSFEGQSMWIPFKYKKLPRIYFHCECILHGKQGCRSGDKKGPYGKGEST